MQIEKAARVAAVVVAIILSVILIVSIARADYPNGFDKIHEICMGSPEVMEGIKGVEVYTPDTYNENNPHGQVMLAAGECEKGIVVGIAVFDKNMVPLVYIAIYHMTDDGSTFVANILTGEKDDISPETVQKFIDQWLKLYDQVVRTPA